MELKQLLPFRRKTPDPIVVRDLDAMISESVGFKFDGRIHVLESISAGELLQVYERFAQIDAVVKAKKVTAQECVDAYASLFMSVCKTITKADVQKMTTMQIGAFYQLIIDTLKGKAQAEVTAQKKTLSELQSPQKS